MQKLSAELVSLVHHVQLNTTGWWDAAIDRLILAAVWAHQGSLLATDLPDEILRQFDVAVDRRALDGSVERLRSKGALVRNGGGALKITEARLTELRGEREEAERLIASVRERFFNELKNAGILLTDDPPPDLPGSPDSAEAVDKELLWSSFETKWLQPTVCSAGARTYDLINGDYSRWVDANGLDGFLGEFRGELHAPLRNALERFLDPTNPDVRAYVLRLMDGYFVVEASQLSASTISRLSAMTGQHPTFTVYLDTNFLFSLLGLHESAAQAAAKSLVLLPTNLQGRVNVRLQVLPATVDETRSALQRELRYLESVRLPRDVAKTVLQSTDVGGVVEAYVRAAAQSDRTLTPAAFFDPYVSSLTAVLATHGITVANAPLADVAARPEVEADINTQEEYEKQKYGSRAKSRMTIQHDVALWHYVNSRRAPRVDTPSDAGYWIVTEDSRLSAFDVHKRGESEASGDSLPICLQPLALVQMLQFWLGRSERVEEALVGAFKLSMLSRHFDPASERATITILDAISRWENLADLPQEAVAHLLVNDALRAKLGHVDDDKQRAELVRDEILLEYRRAKEQLAKSSEETARLRKQVDQAHANFAAQIEAERIRTEAERQRADTLEHERVLDRAGMQELEKRLVDVEGKMKRRAFLTNWIALPAVLMAGGVVLLGPLLGRAGIPFGWKLSGPLLLLFTVPGLWFATHVHRDEPSIRDWQVYRVLAGVRGAMVAILLATFYGVLGNIATEIWWKPIASDQPAVPGGEATPPAASTPLKSGAGPTGDSLTGSSKVGAPSRDSARQKAK